MNLALVLLGKIVYNEEQVQIPQGRTRRPPRSGKKGRSHDSIQV